MRVDPCPDTRYNIRRTALEEDAMARVSVLSDEFIATVVARRDQTPPEEPPAEYHGLAAADLRHIRRCVRGRPRAQYPQTCTLSSTVEGLPHFACTLLDGPSTGSFPAEVMSIVPPAACLKKSEDDQRN